MKDEPDTPAALRARALRYLVRREHSRAELERRLSPHAESHQALESVLDLLHARRHQSDERYAEERARVLFRKYGVARIRQDLKAKGVSEEIVRRVVSASDDLKRAQEILRKKYPSSPRSHAERAQRARFLQSRGFSYDIIGLALRTLPDDPV